MNPDSNHNISLLFVLSDNISYGSGTQQVVLSYVRAFKEIELNINIKVLDTNHLPGNIRRLSKEYIHSVMNEVSYETIALPALYNLLGKTRFKKKVFGIIVTFVTLKIIGRIIYRKLIDNLSNCDFIILIDNGMAFLFPKNTKAKLVGTAHSLFEGSKNIEMLKNNKLLYWKRLDIFISLINEPSILKSCNIPVFVLPNGVDTKRYYPIQKKNKRLKFIFFARLSKEKGVIELLEIWKKVRNKDKVELHIAGDGPLRNFVADSKLESFYYHGKLEDDKIIDFIQSGDILLYPTFRDVYPLVVLESFSCGVYCMLSDKLRGVFDDFISRGFGEYFNATDTSVVASRIDKLILEKKEQSDDIYEYVSSNYDWKNIVTRLLDNLLRYNQ